MSVPPELLAQLQGGAMGGQGMSPAGAGSAPDPLAALQEVIQLLPGVMSALPDAKDTQDIARALLLLTGIQTRMMAGPSGPQGGQGQ